MRADWLHVDINSYFATLLQQENPALRGRPVGVLKEMGRTCVIAASKEAKTYGVKTGCSRSEAERLAQGIVFVAAPFDRCLAATKRLVQIFNSLVPNVEVFSLDEAFLDLRDCVRIYPDPHRLGREIQRRVKAELGDWVTCNVGLGPNRFLAKMSGEIAPKGSVSEINEQNRDEILASVSFDDVCGIGPRLGRRLNRLGANNPYLIRLIPNDDLEREFGPFWSVELRKMSLGQEPAHLERVDDVQPMKSVSRSTTGYQLCQDEDAIKRVLYNLMEEVTYKTRRLGMSGRYAAIGLSGDDQSWFRHQTLKRYIRHTSDLFDLLYHQFYLSWQRSFPVIRYWVSLGMLKAETDTPQSWFPQWERNERLSQAMDQISDKYGLFTLRSGVLASQLIIRPEVTGYLGDKQYQFL